jgi:integrase
MRVALFACGPAANESELTAFQRIKSALQAEVGEGAWVLLTNVAFSVTNQLQSDEIDLIVLGPSGVRVVEIKHWTAILGNLPRFERGTFVFTTTNGMKPIVLGSKIKRQLDRAMLAELRDAAKQRGEMHSDKVKLMPFVNHDIRRTMRTGLATLKIPREVAEATLAHERPSLIGVYDLHDYQQEKLQALEAWGAKLRGIIESKPEPDNIVKLRAVR